MCKYLLSFTHFMRTADLDQALRKLLKLEQDNQSETKSLQNTRENFLHDLEEEDILMK